MKLKILLLSLLIVFTTTSCSLPLREYEYTSEEFIMDTFIKIKVYADNENKAKESTKKAFQEFKKIELLTNRFAKEETPEYEKSEIIKINKEAALRPVKVSQDVFEMISLAKEYSTETKGAFEITIAPVMDLWGFGTEKNNIPEDMELRNKLDIVGSDKIILDRENNTVALAKNNMSLDLGAIAKGYATQKSVEALRNSGIEKAIVNAGGNIYVLGEKEKGNPWKIGIQDPRKEESIIAVLNLKDQVTVTSGDYQRYFEVNGKRYHHILDPRTAKPATGLLSVTVITDNSTKADILSTSFFVLGLDESLVYLEKHPDILAFFVTKDNKIIFSPGLKEIVELKESEDYSYEERR
ncbi:thiamine biosynthesis lipoprotein [Desulfonispora thiosulfatigenes DSM 11270]|uniref:FAD:protein FMN transferase n=1 Tax=Desulfonispora thiosulfatigenes DSM 11270 TaxID=656914 RepID=A0A1W1UIT5_DESTI|nr:FAD:protein FMN transferase [Desulfonispora thiosulfatigenes]SMB80987.1 thiamine biosynthesis lipoprotein [Desulfonispora thiosulfatigenes DSM 11270]